MIPKRTRLQRFNKYAFRKKLLKFQGRVLQTPYSKPWQPYGFWQKKLINVISQRNDAHQFLHTSIFIRIYLESPELKIQNQAFKALGQVVSKTVKEESVLIRLLHLFNEYRQQAFAERFEFLFNLLVPKFIDGVTLDLEINNLIELIVSDYDKPTLKRLALDKLEKVSDVFAIQMLASAWANTRNKDLEKLLPRWHYTETFFEQPYLEERRILACLKTGFIEDIGEVNYLNVGLLAVACNDKDEQIAERATALLINQSLTADWLERVGRQWTADRPNLTKVLAAHPYWQLPDTTEIPPENSQGSFEEGEEENHAPLEWRWDWRVRLALKLGQLDWLTAPGAPIETVPLLVEESASDDPEIAANAWRVLATLNSRAGQDALCEMVIKGQMPPTLLPIVLQADYAPMDRPRQVLFYFLTEQWDKYEKLDWDQRILQLAYQTGSVTLQRRLAQRIRNSGRVEYLQILASSRRQAAALDPENQGGIVPQVEKAGMVVQILEKNGEWEQMWRLVRQLPLARSVYAVRKLAEQGWQPTQGEEQALFAELDRLSQQPLITSLAKLKRIVAANRFEGLAEPVKQLFSQPLAQAQPQHLNSLIELRESGQQWAEPVQASLDYLESLLRWRLRFAVELSEETSPPAEFDIEIG